ncbi:MAG: 2-keto-3-deoxy-L-rhamnonate aldolase, partial [Quisquiliibacterium sp.]
WIGHFDLSNFMGIPGRFDDPLFEEAMRRIAQAARRHGKAAGIMASDQAWIERSRQMGYTMIAAGTDMGLFGSALAQLLAHARDEGTR